MNTTVSNILKIILVLVIIGGAVYLLYPYLQESLKPAPEPVKITDPYEAKFEQLNKEIGSAKTAAKINSLHSNVSALRAEVADTNYTKYLALADAQLATLKVLNTSALYDSETALISKQGVDCSRDYGDLQDALGKANSTKASALNAISTYLVKNPNSSAVLLKAALDETDIDLMHLIAGLLEEEQAYLCLEEETPSGTYTLPLNESEAARLVADEVWTSGYYVYSIGKALPVNTVVSTRRGSGELVNRTMHSETWFFMLDDRPDALWSHDAKFVFVDAATGKYSVSEESSYPIIDGAAYWLSFESRMNETWIVYPDNPQLNASLSTAPRRTFVDGKLYVWPLAVASPPAGTSCSELDCCEGVGKDKGLVVAGDDEKLFHNDAQGMYDFLKAGRHMSAGDITYLTAKSGVPESDGKTNLASFKAALEALAKDTECCDRVFIYLTGHGNNVTMWLFKNKKTGDEMWFARGAAIKLNRSEWNYQRYRGNFHHIDINPYEKETMPDGKVVERGDKGGGFMWAEDIGALLDKIKSCYVTLMYDSCHSGPAAPWLAGKGRSVMTTSNSGSSWGFGGHGVFNTQWIYAHGLFADEADANNDGKVSDKEAFDFANKETKDKVKKKTGKDQGGTWTDPKPPCVCCDVICNEKTKYLCTVVDGNGTIDPQCKKVGDYCGPTVTEPPPNITENWTPGTGGGITVGGGGEAVPPVCGDGVKAVTEECENDTDCPKYRYCDKKTCTCKQYPLICGDGKIAAGEECDPKATPTGCSEGLECSECVCTEPMNYCGDGKLSPTEECEVGISCESENEQCNMGNCLCEEKPTEPPEDEGYCGDGIVQQGEACESSPDCPTDFTCSNCQCIKVTVEYCGDGAINGDEVCDDSASPTGCTEPAVCATNCGSCVSPPNPDCETACAQLAGSTLLGVFSTAESCSEGLLMSYFPARTPCYVNCWYSKALGYHNIAGSAWCCCGMKKEFPCSDCPGQNPYCDESLCDANAPSWAG